MSPAAEAIRADALDAQALNHHQRLLVVNPSDEIDSIAEHVRELVRLATPAQRPHLRAVLKMLRDLVNSNQAEAERERRIAGAADHLASVGEPWGKRRVARELRDPLANLASPIITGAARDDALRRVLDVVALSTRENVLSETVLHEIGAKRFALLTEIVDLPLVTA